MELTCFSLRLWYTENGIEFIGEVQFMLTENKVREVLGGLIEPFLHKTLTELNAIEEVKIKEEKNHVSVKVLIARTGTSEQLQLQTQIVNALKEAGAATVGIRFAEL